MKTILITGGAGFIASNLIELLVTKKDINILELERNIVSELLLVWQENHLKTKSGKKTI